MPTAVRRLLSGLALSAAPDADLLARYADDRDPAAFAELVRRFGPLVLGTCRRAAGTGPEADDAFQAVFLALARRADRVRDAAALPAWLHRVAVRAALRVRRPATDPLPDVPGAADPAAVAAENDLRRVIDAELDRLPERVRGPVVLCLLDGLTRDAAAERLGCSVSTVKRRVEAGRGLLRERLVRRGVGVTVVAAALAGEGARADVPAGLAAAAAALAGPTIPPPAVAALAAFAVGRRGVRRVAVAGGLLLTATVMTALAAYPTADPPAAARPQIPNPVADKQAAPHGFFLWPVTTKLQKRLLPAPADEFLLVNGNPAVIEGGANVRKLPLADIRAALTAKPGNTRINQSILFTRVAFTGDPKDLTPDTTETAKFAVVGACHETHFRMVRSEIAVDPSVRDWADLVNPAVWSGHPPDADEAPEVEGPVTAYPVRTALSRALTGNAECVVYVGSRPSGPDVPADVKRATEVAVGRLGLTRKGTVVFVVARGSEDWRSQLPPAYHRFATDLGFTAGNVTTR